MVKTGQVNRHWWPSGLSRHVSNSSRDRCLGPRFEACSGLRYQSLRIRNVTPSRSTAGPNLGRENPNDKDLNQSGWIQAPNQSRAAPSVEAHHRSDGLHAGRNSGGRLIKNRPDCQMVSEYRTKGPAFRSFYN